MRFLFCVFLLVLRLGNAFGQKPPFEAQMLNSSASKKVLALNDGGFLLHETPANYFYGYSTGYDSFALCHTARYD
ncbi:MAG: hypothetical protein EOP53_08575, partial [Sphingobacteriales bacterium]